MRASSSSVSSIGQSTGSIATPTAPPRPSPPGRPAAAASEWPSSASWIRTLWPNQRTWRAIDSSAVTTRTSSMQRLRGSFTIRSRKRASASWLRSSADSVPSRRPLATESPSPERSRSYASCWNPPPRMIRLAGRGAAHTRFRGYLGLLASASTRTRGSARRAHASRRALHQGGAAQHVDALGRADRGPPGRRPSRRAVPRTAMRPRRRSRAAHRAHEQVGRPFDDLAGHEGADRDDRRG